MIAKPLIAAAVLAGLALATAADAQTAADPSTAAAGEAPATATTPVAGSAEASSGGTDPAAAATAETPAVPSSGPDLTPVTFENGRWYNAEGIPTFKIEDGVLDYATFSGFRRYHSECHVCHGPDGEGSSFGPALKKSVMGKIDYYQFQEIVASGKQDVGAASNLVMPAFGTNRNVWCYVDDIYVYLLAHGTGAIPRGRPAKKAEKSPEFTAQEDSCMSG